jgi:hypothetical protein
VAPWADGQVSGVCVSITIYGTDLFEHVHGSNSVFLLKLDIGNMKFEIGGKRIAQG